MEETAKLVRLTWRVVFGNMRSTKRETVERCQTIHALDLWHSQFLISARFAPLLWLTSMTSIDAPTSPILHTMLPYRTFCINSIPLRHRADRICVVWSLWCNAKRQFTQRVNVSTSKLIVYPIKSAFAVMYAFTWRFEIKKIATVIYNLSVICLEQFHKKTKYCKI